MLEPKLQLGAWQTDRYLPKLQNRRVALVVNQTSTIGEVHLADTLLARGVQITKIFAPEHGFRGEASAGEYVNDGQDIQTGLPIISLYGKKKKPSKEDLADVDLVVFDIQDVGARFYTYIYTMSDVMSACAEHNTPFMVLDRPNPNGHYVDGPILKDGFQSGVGRHYIPVVHGMTVGEYAQMVNGEGWLDGGRQCQLEVMTCQNYTHQTPYELPIKPSPNLPNSRSIYLYPSICFIEGTTASLGRGTLTQFQVIGHPDFPGGDVSFTPIPRPGAKYPKHEGKTCYGVDLTKLNPADIRAEGRLNLSYLLNFYKLFPNKADFFLKNGFFDKLAGNAKLKQQVESGLSEDLIRASWADDLATFRQVRAKYLLYED